MDAKTHWNGIFSSKRPEQLTWYQPHLATSFELITTLAPDRNASIIDVGAGEATLVDDLLARGHSKLTVLDISPAALEVAKARLGPAADAVHWICGDITSCALPSGAYDIWHDRAVFHFLTDAAQRRAYVRQVSAAVKPGGHVIVATFGPEGPLKCSGLEVVRYDPEGAARPVRPWVPTPRAPHRDAQDARRRDTAVRLLLLPCGSRHVEWTLRSRRAGVRPWLRIINRCQQRDDERYRAVTRVPTCESALD